MSGIEANQTTYTSDHSTSLMASLILPNPLLLPHSIALPNQIHSAGISLPTHQDEGLILLPRLRRPFRRGHRQRGALPSIREYLGGAMPLRIREPTPRLNGDEIRHHQPYTIRASTREALLSTMHQVPQGVSPTQHASSSTMADSSSSPYSSVSWSAFNARTREASSTTLSRKPVEAPGQSEPGPSRLRRKSGSSPRFREVPASHRRAPRLIGGGKGQDNGVQVSLMHIEASTSPASLGRDQITTVGPAHTSEASAQQNALPNATRQIRRKIVEPVYAEWRSTFEQCESSAGQCSLCRDRGAGKQVAHILRDFHGELGDEMDRQALEKYEVTIPSRSKSAINRTLLAMASNHFREVAKHSG